MCRNFQAESAEGISWILFNEQYCIDYLNDTI